jgi:hypothetical protein
MTEGIVYNTESKPGSTDVTFDGTTYHLPPGRVGKLLHYEKRRVEMTEALIKDLDRRSRRVEAAIKAIEEQVDPVLLGVLEKANDALLAEDGNTTINRQVQQRAWDDVYQNADDELRTEYDNAKAHLDELTSEPFWRKSAGLLADMFKDLGDPLPDDIDDWPAWLATDTKIPRQITDHWKNSPKASGETPPM